MIERFAPSAPPGNDRHVVTSGRRRIWVVLALALAVGSAVPATASAGLVSLPNSNPIAIPAGPEAPARGVPYPSPIAVPEQCGQVNKATVTLHDLSHTYPRDIDVLLAGPRGQSAVLMSDAGARARVSGLTLTFDDAATESLPDSPNPGEPQLRSGTFRPTNHRALDEDIFPPPAPGASGSMLSVFEGTDPTGAWQLYVADDTSADEGSIARGWELTLQCPPMIRGTFRGTRVRRLSRGRWEIRRLSLSRYERGSFVEAWCRGKRGACPARHVQKRPLNRTAIAVLRRYFVGEPFGRRARLKIHLTKPGRVGIWRSIWHPSTRPKPRSGGCLSPVDERNIPCQ